MRVLLSTPDFPPDTGGIQLLLHRLVENSRHQHRVVTLAVRPPSSDVKALDVVRTKPMPTHRTSVLALNFETLRQAAMWRPQALICGHVVSAPAALVAQHHLGVPVLQYLYSDEMRRRHKIAQMAVRRAACSVAISAHTRTQALDLGVEPGRLELIPPGVDLSPRAAGVPATRADTRPTIVTVARMEDRYKGFDVMLRALPLVRRRVDGVRWVVIGDGPLRSELEATADEWGLGPVCSFLGRTSDEVRDSWLSRAHVFALPSRINSDRGGAEGFGIVYLEAGSHYLPCVAGQGTGASDAVMHNRTGLLVDPFDHVAVAEALTSLLLDPVLAATMGLAGRQRAEEHSWGRMAESIDALLDKIAVGNAP